MRLVNRTTLVTGAGQGIGRAIALAFAREGAEVIAASRSVEKMADLPELAPAIRPVGLDVTDRAAVARVVADNPGIDVVVNAAGWVHSGTILDCDEDDWQRSLDQNASSIYRVCRAVLPGMLERGGGSIVNVASVASSVTGVGGRFAYGASKAAVIGLTKALARDFVARGIRCNALCPGTTDTPSLQERIDATPDPAATRRAFVERQAMGRLGTPEEIAAVALHLASDEAGFVTGAVVVADGGQTM